MFQNEYLIIYEFRTDFPLEKFNFYYKYLEIRAEL